MMKLFMLGRWDITIDCYFELVRPLFKICELWQMSVGVIIDPRFNSDYFFLIKMFAR